MTRNEEQAALAKGVWCDSYNFYLKYHGRPADPGFWEEATADFGKIMKKYGGNQMNDPKKMSVPVCCICQKVINGDAEWIRTRRGTVLYMHKECVRKRKWED